MNDKISEIEAFYQQLDEVLKISKNQDVTIILGDSNATVGEGIVNDCVGKYGLGTRNERGERHRILSIEKAHSD